ncbi:hypothetical protein OHA70_19980 [Kribbella sp. NBC_00382]|uniref:hypothetical protein n=1 Tax=Kribbella sp. NBC_00382 TaxID=2975967 RepID=UPI002E23D1D7
MTARKRLVHRIRELHGWRGPVLALVTVAAAVAAVIYTPRPGPLGPLFIGIVASAINGLLVELKSAGDAEKPPTLWLHASTIWQSTLADRELVEQSTLDQRPPVRRGI